MWTTDDYPIYSSAVLACLSKEPNKKAGRVLNMRHNNDMTAHDILEMRKKTISVAYIQKCWRLSESHSSKFIQYYDSYFSL